MTVPTLADSIEIVRLVLGTCFAAAAFWVAVGPAIRLVARTVRGPIRSVAPPATAANADAAASGASRAA